MGGKMVVYITSWIKANKDGKYESIRKIANLPGAIAYDIQDALGIENAIARAYEGTGSHRYYVDLISREMFIEYKGDAISIILNNEKTKNMDHTVYSIQIVNPCQILKSDDEEKDD